MPPKIASIKDGIVRAYNDQTVDAPKTFLAATVSSGTSLYVYDVSGFYDNWAAQIGETGERETEIIEIDGAPSGTEIGLAAAVSFEHPIDTPVYSIKHNQVVFKSAPNNTATSTAITDGTITRQVTQEYTLFDDSANGTTNYIYQVCGRSTGLASNSPNSDKFPWAGADFYSLGKIRERIKSKALNRDSLVDDDVDSWVNEFHEKMTNTLIDVNRDYVIGTTSVSWSGTVQYGTITDADFKQVRKAIYTENDTDYYRMIKQDLTDFTPDEDYNETYPFFHMRGDTEFGRNPHSNSATAIIEYYKLNPVLNSAGDNLPQPMRGYSNAYVTYGLAQAKRLDNKEREALNLEAQAEMELKRFKIEMQPRHRSGPEYIDIVEPVSQDEGMYWW